MTWSGITALRVRRTRLIVRIHLPAIRSSSSLRFCDFLPNFPYKTPEKKKKKTVLVEHLLVALVIFVSGWTSPKSWGFFWVVLVFPKKSPLSDNYLLQRCWSESTVDASEIRDQLTSWGKGSWNPIIYLQGLENMPGGCLGFLPSTVLVNVNNMWLFECIW